MWIIVCLSIYATEKYLDNSLIKYLNNSLIKYLGNIKYLDNSLIKYVNNRLIIFLYVDNIFSLDSISW